MMVDDPTTTVRASLTDAFRQHSPRIYGMLRARCGDPTVAEELTAQTFEEAARRFAAGRGHEVGPAWLTTVALRRLTDHWRSTGRRLRLVERLGNAASGAADAPTGDESSDAIWRALDSLAESQRAAITLRYLDDWSVSEIADALGVSYRAAESTLSRGRRALRTALDEEGVQW